jgi:REP element-mobilizing transposase RayT
LKRERELLKKAREAGTARLPDEKRMVALRDLLRQAEETLDRGEGSCFMKDQRIASVVANTLTRFAGLRYFLLAWCVMPNHVHVVFEPIGRHTLAAILHTWKSFTAHEANRVLGRSGPFWQREYFDHLIRDENSLQRIVKYVVENPRKAGLRNWPWVSDLAHPRLS